MFPLVASENSSENSQVSSHVLVELLPFFPTGQEVAQTLVAEFKKKVGLHDVQVVAEPEQVSQLESQSKQMLFSPTY